MHACTSCLYTSGSVRSSGPPYALNAMHSVYTFDLNSLPCGKATFDIGVHAAMQSKNILDPETHFLDQDE